VHRTRLFASHLFKFGWTVEVLTVDPRYYEEPLDPELEALIPRGLVVVRTRALPTRPVRLIGDVGVRAFWWHYRRLAELAKRRLMDLLFIPIPPNYSATLGPLIERRYGVPFAIDYIDPWVQPWPASERPFTKAWFAFNLGRILEPWVLKKACLVTAVAPGYYEGALTRYPWLDPARCVAMPYGAEEADVGYLDSHPRPPYLFDVSDGRAHLVYAGVMWQPAYATVEAILEGVKRLSRGSPAGARKLCLHFVGTGNQAGTDGFSIRSVAERLGISAMVEEHPERIPYLDVLNHLRHAAAVLVVGSSDRHYTASKIFSAVLSGRPVVAVLREESTAAAILREVGAGPVVTFSEKQAVSQRVEEIAEALKSVATTASASTFSVDWAKFRRYSAEAMTKRLAEAFDSALARGLEPRG
jgi:hypothetical protein